jgi:glycosyltransferase involved in cell wall biosynthesis
MVRRALESVLNQEYGNLEVIVVDDNGQESHFRRDVEVGIQSINDNRIKLVQHKKNLGACAARNSGISKSNGEYIAFLDDDDEWLPQKVALQVDAFMKNRDVALVYCNNYIQKGNSRPVLQNRKLKYGYCFKELLYSNFIGSTSFVMLKTSVFFEVGLFNEEMQSSQDYELWLRIAKTQKILGIDTPLVIYHVHDGDRISSSSQKKIEGLEMLNSIYWDEIKKDKRLLSRRLIVLSPYYQIRDGYWKGVLHSIRSYLICPFAWSHVKFVLNAIIGRS